MKLPGLPRAGQFRAWRNAGVMIPALSLGLTGLAVVGTLPPGPRHCPALEPWLGHTRANIAQSDTLLQEVKDADLSWTLSSTTMLMNYAQKYHDLSDAQHALTTPPGLGRFNEELALAFDAYGDTIDGSNTAGFAIGAINVLFGGDFDESVIDAANDNVYWVIEQFIESNGSINDFLEVNLTPEICAGQD
ncbi:MAG: hypothetical protein QM692_08455 [Thermomicrobiales bacterium]